MVMTDRSKGIEIIRKIESKSQECIVRELDKLERRLGAKKFRETFKTITCDNGCEKLDFKGMERPVLTTFQERRCFTPTPTARGNVVRMSEPTSLSDVLFPKELIFQNLQKIHQIHSALDEQLSKEKARMAFSFRCVTFTKPFFKSLVTFYIAIFYCQISCSILLYCYK